MINIIGQRITLVPMTLSYVTDAYVSWMNDFEVTQYLENGVQNYSKSDIFKFVDSILSDNNVYFYAIIENERWLHIGNIKLGPVSERHKRGCVGILLGDKTCWGKGYGTEAVKLVTDYAFLQLGLKKVTAGCLSCNNGSEKIFLKNGFLKEAVLKAHYFFEGQFVDGYVFGKSINDC